jgi:signal peptidase I
MESTFSQGDFIIVDKVTPKYGDLERWDILVFVPEGKDVPFIKRVIWVWGETVVVKDGDIYLCGDDLEVIWNDIPDVWTCEQLDEPYLDEDTNTLANCNKKVFPIQEGALFMAGDNRSHSTDSRCCFGSSCYDWANYTITPEHIIGKVAVRLYPSIEKY